MFGWRMRNLILTLALMGGINLAAADPTADRSPLILPNPQLTPGTFFADATLDKICQKGYTATVRHVTEEQRKEVFAEYGIPESGKYEVDHRLPLENSGSNDIRNLWPQSYIGIWSARIKDKLENRIHSLMCSNLLSLEEGRQIFLDPDWRKGYCHYFKDKIKDCADLGF